MQRHYEKLKDEIKSKESYIRQLEDDIAAQNRNNYKDTKEFSTFGNSKIKSEVNIIDEQEYDQDNNYGSDLQDLYERRIRDLEIQVDEYRSKEQDRINGLLSINSSKARDLQEQMFDHDDENFARASLDTIAILAYELCELEIKEHSKRYNSLVTSQVEHSLLASQTHRSFGQNNNFEVTNS